MRSLRVVFGILSLMLILAGLVVGLHEMGDVYTKIGDQLRYAMGSTIAMLVYVAGIWTLYGIIAGIRLIVLQRRHHRAG